MLGNSECISNIQQIRWVFIHGIHYNDSLGRKYCNQSYGQRSSIMSVGNLVSHFVWALTNFGQTLRLFDQQQSLTQFPSPNREVRRIIGIGVVRRQELCARNKPFWTFGLHLHTHTHTHVYRYIWLHCICIHTHTHMYIRYIWLHCICIHTHTHTCI